MGRLDAYSEQAEIAYLVLEGTDDVQPNISVTKHPPSES